MKAEEILIKIPVWHYIQLPSGNGVDTIKVSDAEKAMNDLAEQEAIEFAEWMLEKYCTVVRDFESGNPIWHSLYWMDSKMKTSFTSSELYAMFKEEREVSE